MENNPLLNNNTEALNNKNICKRYFIITSLPLVLIPSNILWIYYWFNNYYITLTLVILTTIWIIMWLFLPWYYKKLTKNWLISEECNKILTLYISSFPIIIMYFCLILFWKHIPVFNVFFAILLSYATIKIISRKI